MSLGRVSGSALAGRIFARDTPQALALLRAAWPRAVGPELARRTELLAVERATLRVKVPDARWHKVLHRMQPEILVRLRQIVGDLAPRRLGFSEGSVEAPRPPKVPDSAASPAAALTLPESVAAQARAIADPEIRARFERSAAIYLSRARASSCGEGAPIPLREERDGVFRGGAFRQTTEAGFTPAEVLDDGKAKRGRQ